MALSGRILGSFSGTNDTYARPVITWTATQSISGNYSTVTANLIFEKYLHMQSFNRNGHSVTFTINGNKSVANRTFDIRNGHHTIWTRTVRVNHSSDGTKSFSLSASGSTGVSLGSYNFSGTGSLTQIPRASSLSSFSINANLKPSTANQVNLGISRATGSSYKHDIQLRDGNHVLQSWTGQNTPTTLPIDSSTVTTLLNRMSNSTTRSLTLRVQTKNGSTNIGGAVTRNATATVDSTVRPTATGLTLNVDGTRRDNSRGIYVQGYSRVKVSFTEKAVGGAKVSSRNIVIRHNSSKKNVSSINSTSGTSWVLSLSGTYEVIATVTDSRGRTNTQTRSTFTVQAYSPPKVTSFKATRNSSTPTTVNISRYGNYTPIGTGHNSMTISVQRRQGTGAWSNVVDDVKTAAATFGASVPSTGNSVTQSYEFRVVVTDLFGGRAEATATISTQRVVLDIHKNEGVGIGKVHERGVLDVDGPMYSNGIRIDAAQSFGESGLTVVDTPQSWASLPQGTYFVSVDKIPNQPSNYGYLIQSVQPHATVESRDFNALWYSQGSGTVFRKSGTGKSMSDWVILDRPDYGSNTNGQWVRFNDGTQFCWHPNMEVTYTNSATLEGVWTYPKGFVSGTQVVTGNVEGTWGAAADQKYWGNPLSITIYSANARVRLRERGSATFASGNKRDVYVMAMGRWK